MTAKCESKVLWSHAAVQALALLAFLGDPMELRAQSILPWRSQVEQRLRDQNALIAQLIAGQRQQMPQSPPIILQPQVAILGMGGIFKEPVVITDEHGNDSIAIRHIIRLVLGYDHRIIDGAEADQFMVAVRDYLEKFDEDIG